MNEVKSKSIRDPVEIRLRTLERKIDNLSWIVGAQTVLLGVVTAAYLLKMAQSFVLLAVILVPLLVLFRRQLPGLARRLGSLVAFLSRRFRTDSPL